MILFILFMTLIAGLSEGIMDSIQFHFKKTRFSRFKNQSFWDPNISWKNKWKNGDPSLGERFKFSSTLLVGLTDAWHLFKLIRNLSIFSSLPLISFQTDNVYMLIFIIAMSRLTYGIGFQISYR